MSGRVETRRSSKQIENSNVGGDNTYMMRSSERSRTRDSGAVSPLLSRKRGRDEHSHLSRNCDHASPSTHPAKRFKAVGAQDAGRLTKCETQVDEDKADAKVTTLSSGKIPIKKLSPAMAKMKVLQDRFARVVQALLQSEAKQVEAKIGEVKRGVCKELNAAHEPLEMACEMRIAIAEKRLALQKDEADRLWMSARTSAQYSFIHDRGDLRQKMGLALSRKMFDITREYRQMGSVSLGVVPEERMSLKTHASDDLSRGPRGVTLTEKDEDLLLMNIPVRSAVALDAVEAREIAPILQNMVTPKTQATKQKPVLRGPNKPLIQRGYTRRALRETQEESSRATRVDDLHNITGLLQADNLPSQHRGSLHARNSSDLAYNGRDLVGHANLERQQFNGRPTRPHDLFKRDTYGTQNRIPSDTSSVGQNLLPPARREQGRPCWPGNISGTGHPAWPPQAAPSAHVDRAVDGNHVPQSPASHDGHSFDAALPRNGILPQHNTNLSHSGSFHPNGPAYSHATPKRGSLDHGLETPARNYEHLSKGEQQQSQRRPSITNSLKHGDMLPPLVGPAPGTAGFLHPFKRSEASTPSNAFNRSSPNGHESSQAHGNLAQISNSTTFPSSFDRPRASLWR